MKQNGKCYETRKKKKKRRKHKWACDVKGQKKINEFKSRFGGVHEIHWFTVCVKIVMYTHNINICLRHLLLDFVLINQTKQHLWTHYTEENKITHHTWTCLNTKTHHTDSKPQSAQYIKCPKKSKCHTPTETNKSYVFCIQIINQGIKSLPTLLFSNWKSNAHLKPSIEGLCPTFWPSHRAQKHPQSTGNHNNRAWNC